MNTLKVVLHLKMLVTQCIDYLVLSFLELIDYICIMVNYINTIDCLLAGFLVSQEKN